MIIEEWFSKDSSDRRLSHFESQINRSCPRYRRTITKSGWLGLKAGSQQKEWAWQQSKLYKTPKPQIMVHKPCGGTGGSYREEPSQESEGPVLGMDFQWVWWRGTPAHRRAYKALCIVKGRMKQSSQQLKQKHYGSEENKGASALGERKGTGLHSYSLCQSLFAQKC